MIRKVSRPPSFCPICAGAQRADHSAHKPNGDREALVLRDQAVELDQRIDRAGNHHGVKAEKQAAQRSGQGGFHQVDVGSHGSLVLEFRLIGPSRDLPLAKPRSQGIRARPI